MNYAGRPVSSGARPYHGQHLQHFSVHGCGRYADWESELGTALVFKHNPANFLLHFEHDCCISMIP